MSKAGMEQDVKYKTADSASLDKTISELSGRLRNSMSPNLPDKVVLEGIPPTLLLQWAFHGRGGYTPPDALAVVRRHVASICDRSFDLISILGDFDFGSNSYIGTKIFSSEIDLLRLI